MKDNKFWALIANPSSILLLCAAPALAAASDVKSGFVTGMLAFALLLVLTILAVALRRIIASGFRLPIFTILAVAVCSAVRMELHALLPQVYGTLGIYITLLGLGTAFFAVAQSETGVSLKHATGNAFKAATLFLLTVLLSAFICEFFGSGSVAGTQIDFIAEFKNSILTYPAGKVMVYGLVASFFRLFYRKNTKKEEKA